MKSIRTKIMASFIAATIVFMTIMGVTLYARVDGKVTDLTEDMALQISRASSVGLSEWLDNMVNLTGAFALVPQVVFDEASAKVFFNPFYPNITRMSKNTLPHSFLSTERLSLSQ